MCFFRADARVLLDASAWLLLCGFCGVEYRFFIFNSLQKFLYTQAIELQPIVSYNQLGYSEPAYDVLLYELNNLFIFAGCEGFIFYPFTEIVSGN